MYRMIAAEKFFEVWCKVVDSEHQGRLLKPIEYWYNRPNKTAFFEHEIYPELANALQLKYSAPYYFIDSVFYHHDAESQTDKVPRIPENITYLRKVRVALEHENIFDFNLYQELSHLLLINCDLKVIVSYSNNYSTDEVFDYLSNIISTHDGLEIKHESILLILGKRELDGDGIYWEGFTYKNAQWVSIATHPIGTLQRGI